ncbi:hypothetical protein [Faecalimicrobium dakarense]|uniref:hypothetical protein n=1 Tax=Faecalimicrobium dakarense TaxID=1301100 RepID=UPI0004BAC0E3|nr:hypothetical protein [[Clostridium] dakarense]
MKKKLIMLFLSLSLLIFPGCSNRNIDSKDSNIEVRGLTLKISLITVAYDVYRVNFKNTTEFNEELYKNGGKYGLQYYEWLKNTYSTMDSNMKRRLIRIFDDYGGPQYITETISLDDNASVEEIVEKLNSQSNLALGETLKEDIQVFFNYFYKEYLKDLIQENNPSIEKDVKKMNSFLAKKNTDIFKFMEENSGIKFKKDYKALFYYDLAPIGAMGFEHENYKISTIQPGTSTDNLLSTPFHEFSHELFRNFTRKDDFTKIADNLRKDKYLVDSYEKLGKSAYDWIGWCEENLVQGFTRYLGYKQYGKKINVNTYAYDLEFYNYLIENNFSTEDVSLEDISIEFYKKVLEEKSK